MYHAAVVNNVTCTYSPNIDSFTTFSGRDRHITSDRNQNTHNTQNTQLAQQHTATGSGYIPASFTSNCTSTHIHRSFPHPTLPRYSQESKRGPPAWDLFQRQCSTLPSASDVSVLFTNLNHHHPHSPPLLFVLPTCTRHPRTPHRLRSSPSLSQVLLQSWTLTIIIVCCHLGVVTRAVILRPRHRPVEAHTHTHVSSNLTSTLSFMYSHKAQLAPLPFCLSYGYNNNEEDDLGSLHVDL
ncbi:hypothetical protein GGR57DRAFT_163079 [Xylariaceae sp. FL1272]|nr:hypothetical protein GGR57DRAFT_163079 [Xylariaceae sp. FL1272]